jgi:hypothetical protein
MRAPKEQILDEIRRTTAENGGQPLGRERFEKETGIKPYHWGKFWSRWSDAVLEAGFAANEKQVAYTEDLLLERLASLARDLGKIPTRADLHVRHHNDPAFPSSNAFDRRLGGKQQLLAKLAEYCHQRPGYENIGKLCEGVALNARAPKVEVESLEPVHEGFVYLLKSGRHYKIGKTNSVGRRERELSIQLPERATKVHSIKTDDPDGIEAYWHRRFGSKRKHGEWFELSVADVAAFRRRKYM